MAEFYKTWDEYGAFNNFSPHPVLLSEEPILPGQSAPSQGNLREWATVEHFYQSQKFAGACSCS